MSKTHTEHDPSTSPMPVLADYIANALAADIPEAVVEKAKYHLLDTLSSMVSGSQMLAGERARAFIRAQGQCEPQAVIVGTNQRSTAINAAMANGMFAHADETDDSHAPSLTHPGCGVVPAALAAAELWSRHGVDLLRAVVLGYDICSRLTMSLDAYAFREAGHSTHSFGPNFGAAAAAGALGGLDALRIRHVLSYAAQQASGIACWMRDTDHIEKSFDFGGMGARNGMTAALMVSCGCTGVDDVFTGQRNFYDAYGNEPDRQALARDLGSRFEILDTAIKRWTVGSPIQAPLDAMDALVRTHRFSADDVQAILVKIPQQMVVTVDNREMPEICLQHILATLIVDGEMGFASAHDRARMHDPAVLAVRSRMKLVGDEALTRAMPSRQGIVEITLRDGRQLREHVRAVRGTPGNPMTREELQAKSMELLAPVLGREQSHALCTQIWNIEEVTDIRTLTSLLSVAA